MPSISLFIQCRENQFMDRVAVEGSLVSVDLRLVPVDSVTIATVTANALATR